MLADVGRSPTPDWTPDWTRSVNRSGHERWEMQLLEPESLRRLKAPPGTFGSPLPDSDSDASSSSHRAAARPRAVAPRAGRPSGLADAGRSAKADMKKVRVAPVLGRFQTIHSNVHRSTSCELRTSRV